MRLRVRMRGWQRYLAVFVLSFPLAFALRFVLQKLLEEDLAVQAVAFVRQEKERPLSEPLSNILSDGDYVTRPTQPHTLLHEVASDFTLTDDQFSEVNLRKLCEMGPVVLVFYYGYSCSHCVAQLFGLNEDITLFQELGAQVIAVSADSHDLTADRFREYGRFAFPVLSDPDHRVGLTYGVYHPPSEGRPEGLLHATFLIGMDGRVFWANYGAKPFLDNKTLLLEIGRRKGIVRPPQDSDLSE